SELGGKRRRVAAGCGNHGNAAANEVSHERRQTIIFALQPVVFEPRVLAFDGAGLVEAFVERSDIARGNIATTAADKSDNRHRCLLRARRERPRHSRAAEKRDELAPLHSITSSARASSVGGTSRPSALAVLRLITSSNLVGCCTGRSAGFAPLRIRPA